MSARWGIAGPHLACLSSLHSFQCLGGFLSAFDDFYLPLTLHPPVFLPVWCSGFVAILVSCSGGVLKAFLACVCPFVRLDSVLVCLHLSGRIGRHKLAPEDPPTPRRTHQGGIEKPNSKLFGKKGEFAFMDS